MEHPTFDLLKEKFRNSDYEIFLKIDWNELRDEDEYEHGFENYREYETFKEAEIRSSFNKLTDSSSRLGVFSK